MQIEILKNKKKIIKQITKIFIDLSKKNFTPRIGLYLDKKLDFLFNSLTKNKKIHWKNIKLFSSVVYQQTNSNSFSKDLLDNFVSKIKGFNESNFISIENEKDFLLKENKIDNLYKNLEPIDLLIVYLDFRGNYIYNDYESKINYINVTSNGDQIISPGIKSLLIAKKLIIISLDENASPVVKKLVSKDVDEQDPYTLLNFHDNAILYTSKNLISKKDINSHLDKQKYNSLEFKVKNENNSNLEHTFNSTQFVGDRFIEEGIDSLEESKENSLNQELEDALNNLEANKSIEDDQQAVEGYEDDFVVDETNYINEVDQFKQDYSLFNDEISNNGEEEFDLGCCKVADDYQDLSPDDIEFDNATETHDDFVQEDYQELGPDDIEFNEINNNDNSNLNNEEYLDLSPDDMDSNLNSNDTDLLDSINMFENIDNTSFDSFQEENKIQNKFNLDEEKQEEKFDDQYQPLPEEVSIDNVIENRNSNFNFIDENNRVNSIDKNNNISYNDFNKNKIHDLDDQNLSQEQIKRIIQIKEETLKRLEEIRKEYNRDSQNFISSGLTIFKYKPALRPCPMLMYYDEPNNEVFESLKQDMQNSLGFVSKDKFNPNKSHMWNHGAYLIYDKESLLIESIIFSDFALLIYLLRTLNKEMWYLIEDLNLKKAFNENLSIFLDEYILYKK